MPRFRSIPIGLALATSLFLLLPQMGACTSLTNDAPLDDAGVFDGNVDGASVACPSCRVAQCTALHATCFDSASCTKIAACAQKPNCDAACKAQCLCESPASQAFYVEVSKCDQAAQCATCKDPCSSTATCTGAVLATRACGVDVDGGDAATATDSGAPDDASADAQVTDAGVADAAPPKEACASCVGQCSNEQKACALGSQCDEYLQCALACGTVACVTECATAHPTGQTAVAAYARCVKVKCGESCGL